MENLRSFIAECEANAIPDDQIDLTDIPEITDEEAKDFHYGNRCIDAVNKTIYIEYSQH